MLLWRASATFVLRHGVFTGGPFRRRYSALILGILTTVMFMWSSIFLLWLSAVAGHWRQSWSSHPILLARCHESWSTIPLHFGRVRYLTFAIAPSTHQSVRAIRRSLRLPSQSGKSSSSPSRPSTSCFSACFTYLLRTCHPHLILAKVLWPWGYWLKNSIRKSFENQNGGK